MAIFLLIVFSINFGISAPSNKQTLTKVDFEISVQRTYLKKWGTRNLAGQGVMLRKNIASSLLQLNTESKPFLIFTQLHQPAIFFSILVAQIFAII